MPEGDSIHRLASRLAPILVNREVTSFTARRIPDADARAIVGKHVVDVVALGKNLLIRFNVKDDDKDDGRTQQRVLHIHLRMDGRIFVERPRSTFWAPRSVSSHPELRLTVKGGLAIVGRRLPVCRILSETQAARARDLAGLGPDLLREGFNEDEALERLRSLTKRSIAEALLVQRAAAGIGNVYKSEVLFLEGIDPRVTVSSVTDDTLRALLRRASVLLRRNVGKGPRTTRPTLGSGPRVWVYGRLGRPCLRCGTSIIMFRQGVPPGRTTYACPRCQSGANANAHGAS